MSGPGRPATTVDLCHEIHSLLLESGIPLGSKVPRPLWDKLVGRGAKVSWAQTENITRTGANLGLWERRPNAGRVPGSIVLRDEATVPA
jgi:hypothetical protein